MIGIEIVEEIEDVVIDGIEAESIEEVLFEIMIVVKNREPTVDMAMIMIDKIKKTTEKDQLEMKIIRMKESLVE